MTNVLVSGFEPFGAPIDPDGPLAYASTLPVDAIVAALHTDCIPRGAVAGRGRLPLQPRLLRPDARPRA